jgi:hypothetical protein
MRRDGEGSTAVAREEGQDSTVAQSKLFREGLGPTALSATNFCTRLSARHHRGFCLIRRVRHSSCTQQATQLLQEASEPIMWPCDEQDKSHDYRLLR